MPSARRSRAAWSIEYVLPTPAAAPKKIFSGPVTTSAPPRWTLAGERRGRGVPCHPPSMRAPHDPVQPSGSAVTARRRSSGGPLPSSPVARRETSASCSSRRSGPPIQIQLQNETFTRGSPRNPSWGPSTRQPAAPSRAARRRSGRGRSVGPARTPPPARCAGRGRCPTP